MEYPASFPESIQNTPGTPRSPSLRQRAKALNNITRATERGQIDTYALSLFSAPFLPTSAVKSPLGISFTHWLKGDVEMEVFQPTALQELAFCGMDC